MKLITPAIALSLVALTAQTAAASKPNFRVYNDTASTLTQLYVSDSNRTTWDNNIISQNLPSGSYVRVGSQSP